MCHDISVRGPAPGTQLGHPHQGRRWGAVAAGTPGSPPGTPARPGGPGSAGSCLEQRWLRRRHPRPRSPPPPPARTEPLPLKCSTLSVMATSGCCRRRGSVRRRLTHPRRAAGTGQDRTGRGGGVSLAPSEHRASPNPRAQPTLAPGRDPAAVKLPAPLPLGKPAGGERGCVGVSQPGSAGGSPPPPPPNP